MGSFTTFSCQDRGKELYNNFGNSEQSRRWYQHDIDQIVYSTAFRKLQKKYQLLSDKDPRCRSRMVHTLEVSRIAKEISEQLGLNVELTEAISLAHDLANSAYGAVSNQVLSGKTNGLFTHEEAGCLMIKYITMKELSGSFERQAVALLDKNNTDIFNIKFNDYFPYHFEVYLYNEKYYYTCMCNETLDGVRKHGKDHFIHTLEGQVVSFADNIAYLSQDIDDLISTGAWKERQIKEFESLMEKLQTKISYPDFPSELDTFFDRSSSARIGTLIKYFVASNIKKICKSEIHSHVSPVLNKKIPVLCVDEYLQYVIDSVWQLLSSSYKLPMVMHANNINKNKIEVLWDILDDKNPFVTNNQSYKDFFKRFEIPYFKLYQSEKSICDGDWNKWKRAYFIASLSSDEIDLILDLYQQRDFTFELDL